MNRATKAALAAALPFMTLPLTGTGQVMANAAAADVADVSVPSVGDVTLTATSWFLPRPTDDVPLTAVDTADSVSGLQQQSLASGQLLNPVNLLSLANYTANHRAAMAPSSAGSRSDSNSTRFASPNASTSARAMRPAQPTDSINAATTLAAPSAAYCSGYFTDGCDINAHQSYVPVEPRDLDELKFRHLLPNLVNAVISIPRAYLDALNDLSWALEVTGSWWVLTDTNVLGYDPADPPKITALTNLLIPFKPLSYPVGDQLSWWAKANLPMNAGCTATAAPACRDLNGILENMFLVPIWDLTSGYTFPVLRNPISAVESQAGEEIPGEEGAPTPWSGERVQLNPYDLEISVINYLFSPPEENRPAPITFREVVNSVVRLGKAAWLDFYPFVPGSFIFKGFPYTLLTPLLKPFVKVLCPKCDPDHPEDPTPRDGELPPSSEADSAGEATLRTAGTVGTAVASARAEGPTDSSATNIEADAVNGLIDQFKTAADPTTEPPATAPTTDGSEGGDVQTAGTDGGEGQIEPESGDADLQGDRGDGDAPSDGSDGLSEDDGADIDDVDETDVVDGTDVVGEDEAAGDGEEAADAADQPADTKDSPAVGGNDAGDTHEKSDGGSDDSGE